MIALLGQVNLMKKIWIITLQDECQITKFHVVRGDLVNKKLEFSKSVGLVTEFLQMLNPNALDNIPLRNQGILRCDESRVALILPV